MKLLWKTYTADKIYKIECYINAYEKSNTKYLLEISGIDDTYGSNNMCYKVENYIPIDKITDFFNKKKIEKMKWSEFYQEVKFFFNKIEKIKQKELIGSVQCVGCNDWISEKEEEEARYFYCFYCRMRSFYPFPKKGNRGKWKDSVINNGT